MTLTRREKRLVAEYFEIAKETRFSGPSYWRVSFAKKDVSPPLTSGRSKGEVEKDCFYLLERKGLVPWLQGKK